MTAVAARRRRAAWVKAIATAATTAELASPAGETIVLTMKTANMISAMETIVAKEVHILVYSAYARAFKKETYERIHLELKKCLIRLGWFFLKQEVIDVTGVTLAALGNRHAMKAKEIVTLTGFIFTYFDNDALFFSG